MTLLPHIDGGMRAAAVIGHPISHSLSPMIHRRWLDMTGINGVYAAFDIRPENLVAALTGLHHAGLAGLNVTLPHKVAAHRQAMSVSDTVRRVGAANLLTHTKDGWHADNSDVDGVITSLQDMVPIDHAICIGTGGVARAVLEAFSRLNVARVTIVARRAEAARHLLSATAWSGSADVSDMASLNLRLREVRLVVNATPLGMAGQSQLPVAAASLTKDLIVFDTVYGHARTQLVRSAHEAGCRIIDGLDMLVAQARPSFKAFFGVDAPPDAELADLLRQRLQGQAP